jgi:hypothetical protein
MSSPPVCGLRSDLPNGGAVVAAISPESRLFCVTLVVISTQTIETLHPVQETRGRVSALSAAVLSFRTLKLMRPNNDEYHVNAPLRDG